MKRIVSALILFICAAFIFSGCSFMSSMTDSIPEEYLEGIDVPSEYPKDDLKIYNDAVVFDADEDNEAIHIKYGTTDKLDDVIDYYQDLFEENKLTIINIEEDNGFYAVGIGKSFTFEINAQPAKGNYEKRIFTTVVEISIQPYILGTDTLKKMQGFWHACGEGGILSDTTKAYGYAMNFDDKSLDIYDSFVLAQQGLAFEFIRENAIEIINPDGNNIVIEITFETIDEIDVMTLSGDGDIISFKKSSYNTMIEYRGQYGQELLPRLQGFWLFCGFDGEFTDEYRAYGWGVEFDGTKISVYSDGFADFTDAEFTFLNDNTITYGDAYNNQTALTIYIEEYEGQEYITLDLDGSKYYYEHSSYQEMLSYVSAEMVYDTIVYLTDELLDTDIEYLVTDKDWYLTYYMETDGSYEPGEFYNRMHFAPDYTGIDEYENMYYNITWSVENNLIYFYYEDGTWEVYMIDLEYDGNQWYMYLFDADLGYSDSAYVFTIG